MEYVVTLIGNPLKAEDVQAVAERLEAARVEWLCVGKAVDLVVGRESLVDSIVAFPNDYRLTTIDFIAQPAHNRRKKLLICDMDSTMITVECIDELADFVGKKAEVAEITERAMNGELVFEDALKERVKLLKGLPESTLQQCYDERVKMMPGAKELVQTMRKNGAYCVLVSGGFTFFTERVAKELDFHEHYANTLLVEDGHLTGEVGMPILGKEAKLATLRRKVKELGIAADDVLAVGDGANDLPMLLAADLGVAYHAKPNVQAQAKHRINHNDLRALLWVQGITA